MATFRKKTFLRRFRTRFFVRFHMALILVGTALVITVVLVAALEYTRFGAQVRAAVDNQRMARGLGINVDGAFAITFALARRMLPRWGAFTAAALVALHPLLALYSGALMTEAPFQAVAYAALLAACGGGGDGGGEPSARTPTGPVKIALWHSETAANQEQDEAVP